jgi:diguanylate cyclase (GGDEF)-like protein
MQMNSVCGNLKSRVLLAILLVLSIAVWCPQAQGLEAPRLTQVRQVRTLSVDQAGRAIPVHLVGVVTVPSAFKNSFFFMDASGGISVDRVDEAAAPVQAGQRVEIDGMTGSGLFAPVVIAREVAIIGKQKLPAPRILSPEELSGGQQDSQWIALHAQVRSASIQTVWGHPVLVLKADIGSGIVVSVLVRDYSKGGWERYPGSEILMRGACGTTFNDKRQFVGLRLTVSSLDDLEVRRPAPSDPFDLPLRALDSILQFSGTAQARGPVRMHGTVTYAKAGEFLFIQDGPRGLSVRSSQKDPLLAGSSVEVVGYPASGDYGPILDDAIYHVIPGGKPVSPIHTSAASMIVLSRRTFWAAPYDSQLVQLDGQVAEETQDEFQDQLILRDGNVIFRAKLRGGDGRLPKFDPGTVVRVTGICSARIDDVRNTQSFEILLRSSPDVVILQRLPWWQSSGAAWTVALGLLGVLIFVLIAFLLRSQSELRALAMKDPLTAVLNRRGFSLLAKRTWQAALRTDCTLLLFYLDIDRFKEINDTFGHQAGDLALVTVAGAMRECFRPTDVLGRMGGDEFAALCAMPESVAANIERRIVAKLEDRGIREYGFAIDVSVGILVCCRDLGPVSIEELIRRADARMYEKKKQRRTTQD